MDLTDRSLYVNRELSWVEFNQRVLDEASDPSNPLLEQLKFLAIVSSNLDEFFMVRVAGVMRRVRDGVQPRKGELAPAELLDRLRTRIQGMVAGQYDRLRRGVLPAMAREGLRLVDWRHATKAQRDAATRHFHDEVFAALSPQAVDAARPLPHLHNLGAYFLVSLATERPSDEPLLAFVTIPGLLKPFVPLPASAGTQAYMTLPEVIRAHLDEVFLGYRVQSATHFRLTRDADLNIDEDDAEDLLRDIEQALRERDMGRPVRLEIEADATPEAIEFLRCNLELDEADVYRLPGPLNLKTLFTLAGADGYDHLRFAPFLPRTPQALVGQADIFGAIRRRPILLHHPFDSFSSVVEFLQQAAEDQRVLAIKMTLYRTSGDSPIVRALAAAAERGKQVAALVELKARFDEGPNIRWARELEQAGVHVVYGLVGLKTHCKVISVVRAEESGLRYYTHLGTGNYHPQTAKLYTDCGLLTSDEDLGKDATQLFNALTGYSEYPTWRKLAVAPKDLKARILDLIAREAAAAREGHEAWVIAKCNAVLEDDVTLALYRASCAGVSIDLISRGICGLRAGVPGVSENIRVRSIVGRFLEHSRIYCFANRGEPLVYMSSADLMDRNLNRRVETMFPIEDASLRAVVLNQIVGPYLQDTAKTRLLQPDGSWIRNDPAAGDAPFNAQEHLLRRVLTSAAEARRQLGRAATLTQPNGAFAVELERHGTGKN